MSDQNVPPTNAETNTQACSTGCKHNSGVLRAVLYAPVVLILGGLAALATYPELANYATPLIGESASQGSSYTCPISAALGMAGKGGCSSRRSACSSSSSSCASDAFSCCPGEVAAPSTSETSSNGDLTDADSPISAPISDDDAPADAIAVVNAIDQESPSN